MKEGARKRIKDKKSVAWGGVCKKTAFHPLDERVSRRETKKRIEKDETEKIAKVAPLLEKREDEGPPRVLDFRE